MTNTLHRYGAPETLEDDFIVFAMASRGVNDEGSVEKFQKFLDLARPHGPINLGDATKGGVYRPSKNSTLWHIGFEKTSAISIAS